MITCKMNVKKGRVKRRMLMIPPSWGTDEDVPQKQWEELLVTVKMRKKTILKVFRCYFLVVENKN